MKPASELLTILVVHNRYQYAGGEDVETEAQVRLLRQFGDRVELAIADNAEIATYSSLSRFRLLLTATWNRDRYRQIQSELRSLSADLLHVHNFFPLFSPAVHAAAKSCQIPTVQHLHNFRLGCLNALFLREGRICEACLGRNPWRGAIYRCYRHSLAASLGVWQLVSYHRWRQTWWREVDAFIAPSHFAAQKLVEVGLPPERLHVKPNAIFDPLGDRPISPLPEVPTFVYIGRLAPEKGVLLLLEAWERLQKPQWRLEIVGTGPQQPQLEQFVRERQLANVCFRGYVPSAAIASVIEQASLVVVPSQWYETFGRVAIEAFACGRGVLASDLGALSEIVEDGQTGGLVRPGDRQVWVETLRWWGERPSAAIAAGQNARQTYERCYTPAANYKQLKAIYRRVLDR